ncbi:hypothetical protein [Micromonospora aurantiaca (nom. illeg.)]
MTARETVLRVAKKIPGDLRLDDASTEAAAAPGLAAEVHPV